MVEKNVSGVPVLTFNSLPSTIVRQRLPKCEKLQIIEEKKQLKLTKRLYRVAKLQFNLLLFKITDEVHYLRKNNITRPIDWRCFPHDFFTTFFPGVRFQRGAETAK